MKSDIQTDPPTLESRTARLEARAEIEDLLHRYAFLIDDHEFDALGQLFTENAVFGSPGSRHETRAVITENYRNRGVLYPVSLHIVQGSVIEVLDATHARGQVQGFSEQASEVNTVITSFRYHDEYERVDGRWLFASRIVLTLYAMTHAELAAGGLAQDLRKRWPHREAAPAELPPFLFSPGI